MAKPALEVRPHKGKPRTGKSGKGTAFDPAQDLTAAPAVDAVAQLNRPRPSPTRYPIDQETFARLEAAARNVKLPAKKASNLVRDKGKKEELGLHPGMAAPAGPGVLVAPEAAAPVILGNFQGLTDTDWIPPDCTMAVGPQHVLIAANSSVAVYTQAGTVAQAPRTLSAWFGNVISSAKIFDPRALYDQHANRWILLAAAMPSSPAVEQSFFLLSISQSADPLGGWWNYKLDATKDGSTATRNWADYPCLGVDNQALYLTANMFKFGGNFAYAKLRILNKTPLLSGGTATWFDFTKLQNLDSPATSAFTVQPCHTFGAPQVEYLVNSYFTAAPTQNRLTLWAVTNPTTAPTLTRRTVATDPYGQPPPADQRGGGQGLNSGDVRILNAVSRGGSVWAALTTAHNWGEAVNRTAAHWFQINATSGALVQQGVYGSRGLHYFYPAVMPDNNGNMALVCCRCGTSEYASIRFTGRKSTDPLGQLQASALLKAGLGNSQRNDGQGRNRWGDYAGIASDPTDTGQVWFYSMFADAGNRWGTWVGAAQF
jgi:hypothetical protein